MEFGKLENVDHVDWSLPPEDPLSLPYLQRLANPDKITQFYIGTPAWGHKEWVGKIYPRGTKGADYLRYYAQNFNTIELNTSHYRIPTLEQTQKWIAQVGSDFLFCAKMLQDISHRETGMLNKDLKTRWFEFLQGLGKHRGPCFMQLPPHFDYSRKATLFHFLQNWPVEFELALEFRHPSWFVGGRVLPALTQYLQSRGIGLVITDVSGRRDVLHTSISAPFTMLRFIGNNLHPSDEPRARVWAERLNSWSQQGLQRVFYFVHQPEDTLAPEMTNSVIYYLNEEAGAGLDPLRWCR